MAVTKQTPGGEPAKTEGDQAADIPPAKTIDTSGAPQQIVPDVDLDHPAVDANPREKTTAMQNRIDFNDPTKPGADAVVENLNAQGVPTKGGEEAAESVKKGK